MKKLLFFIILIGLTNCKLNEVNKTHGSLNLDKKHKKLELSVSNKNDIVILLGPPSTVSQFDNNTWYYIERKVTNTSIFTLGREKVLKNNVLVLSEAFVSGKTNSLIKKPDSSPFMNPFRTQKKYVTEDTGTEKNDKHGVLVFDKSDKPNIEDMTKTFNDKKTLRILIKRLARFS